MKQKMIRVTSVLLLLICTLTLFANAQEFTPYASDQIDAYDADAIACGNGRLAIEFSIQATDIMKSLGSSKITIYEKYGENNWRYAGLFDQSDDGMTVSGKPSYGTTIYFDGIPGVEYKVVIVVFATDYNNGTDSRTVTRYVTA